MNNKQQYRLDKLATLLVLSITLVSCNSAGLDSASSNTRPDTQERPAQQDTAQWPHQSAINIAMAITGHPVITEQAATEPDTDKPAAVPAAVPVVAKTATVEPPAPPPAAQDLWARLRSGYRLPDADHKRVGSHLQWYVKHPEYLNRVIDRAEPFMYFILDEIDKRNMPAEIALLPIVESAFQPFAYSHGRAAGIWQFIPGTGRMYGLKQDWWYDGRRDVIAATHAALDYLNALNKHFKGDWLLALAAYNSGQGTVDKAIRYNRKRKRPTDFWHLRLPKETRGYVPRLLAISNVFADPDQHGLQLRSLENKPQILIVSTGSQLDLALAADMAGIDLERLYKLNPGYNRWATDPAGPHQLVLPIANVEPFNIALASLP
ncbi:MAG TPA: lytic transglycosylase, partial [Gammaproteobacteria bacterium]|nr:lytic transglycosylase [Gammaproteobacteria bacterium]